MRWLLPLLLVGCSQAVEPGAAYPAPAAGPPTSAVASPTATPQSSPGVAQQPPPTAPLWNYDVVNRYPHDPQAFTQGLIFDTQGRLWESTGLQGRSTLRRVELESGQATVVQKLPQAEFGEGLALSGNRYFWLTWQNHVCHTYSAPDAKQAGPSFRYEGEGWGLCTDPGGGLWMSNGSSTLTLRSAKDFRVQRELRVHSGDAEVGQLNELEWVDGKIFANVWGTYLIACIDPANGEVEGLVDFNGLLSPEEASHADVLNGIAYDAPHRRLYVTGKLWPRLFEVKIRR